MLAWQQLRLASESGTKIVIKYTQLATWPRSVAIPALSLSREFQFERIHHRSGSDLLTNHRPERNSSSSVTTSRRGPLIDVIWWSYLSQPVIVIVSQPSWGIFKVWRSECRVEEPCCGQRCWIPVDQWLAAAVNHFAVILVIDFEQGNWYDIAGKMGETQRIATLEGHSLEATAKPLITMIRTKTRYNAKV